MRDRLKDVAAPAVIVFLLLLSSCSRRIQSEGEASAPKDVVAANQAAEAPAAPQAEPSPAIPNLQAELLDDRDKTTASPLGTFDFKNFTYPLPRGWQHQDSDEITLKDGRLAPVFEDIEPGMSPEVKAELKSERRIGMSYVTTKYLDADADGEDEAFVILKVETGGSAIPQLVYVYKWKDGAPELIWNFRTGDRADGGLKDIRPENGGVTIELFGQDRFILGQAETGKITGDEEQLCCPTYFTRTFYKWNRGSFLMNGKRLSFEIAAPTQPPLENFGEIMNDPIKSKKYLHSNASNTKTPKR